jgi:hypothetical protein
MPRYVTGIIPDQDPGGYSAYWAGMNVSVTNHSNEILVFGQRKGTDTLNSCCVATGSACHPWTRST